RGGDRRVPADRWLRLCGGRGYRRADLRYGPERNHLRAVEPGLVQVLPRSDAAAGHGAECLDAPACGGEEVMARDNTTQGHRSETPLLRLDGVGKNYGKIIALRDVSFDLDAGSATCVLGDNGAGKSTLIKIISGLHQHDAGTYEVVGQQVRFHSPREALDHGIATVYQDLAVVPLMPVWRNFFLGNEVRKGPRLDIGFMRKTTKKEMLDMG